MITKFTPGPWKNNCFLVSAKNGRDITHTGILGRRKSSFPEQTGSEEDEANARLIAAAPALLAACKYAVGNCIRCENGLVDIYEYENDPGHNEPCPCCGYARRTIAELDEWLEKHGKE